MPARGEERHRPALVSNPRACHGSRLPRRLAKPPWREGGELRLIPHLPLIQHRKNQRVVQACRMLGDSA